MTSIDHVLAIHPWGVAVDKPSGLPSVPGRTAELADCMWSRVRTTHPEALVVHRLDMATSGVMLFALGAQAQRRMNDSFQQRRVDKRYVAEVHGLVADDKGSMNWPLTTDWPRRPRQRVDPELGKPSLTHYHVVSRDAERHLTRLVLNPVTGRSHQLRVHCLALGHPIIGDRLYGTDDAAVMRLHAWRIELPDPSRDDDDDEARVAFESSVPSWS